MLKHEDDPLNGPSASYVAYFAPAYTSAFELQWSKGTWTMRLVTVADGVVDGSAKTGELARIAVGSNVMEFPARADVGPTAELQNDHPRTTWEVAYDLNAEQLTALSSAPIAAIALTIGGKEYRLPMLPKAGSEIQEALVCAAAVE